jgi:hypothetical protein
VPTRCRHRGGIVDPLDCKACRDIRQPNQPIQSDTGSLNPKYSKTSQFSVIRRFIGIESHASESYYHSYTVATSGVNRLASQICHPGVRQIIVEEGMNYPLIGRPVLDEMGFVASQHLGSVRDKFHLHDFSHIGEELLKMGKQPLGAL